LDVFFYETFTEEAKCLKQYMPRAVKAGFTWKTIQECGDKGPPSGVISIRTQSRVPESWAEYLSGILTRSTGYDHILAFLQESSVDLSCGYLPPYCSRSVAEQAMLMWMALMRNLIGQASNFPRFNRDGLTGRECEGKTLLVVGVGNIGYEVVRIGKGLGMRVLGVDIVKHHDSVDYVSIDQGLTDADIIVCAMNLTAENNCYFNYHLLKQARPGVIFVNISRGEQSPSTDLLRLLEEGHLGGVGLDVFNHESELADSLRGGRISSDEEVVSTLKLKNHANVILTPHNAFNTFEAIARKARLSVEQIEHFLKEGEFLWPVVWEDTIR
jgi:D-lactate dehydrogenase